MKKLQIIFFCFLFGFGPEAPPLKPTITVDQVENNSQCSIVIKYVEHPFNTYRDRNSICFVAIYDFDELKRYKSQVKFLLEKIEETEKKMTINEQNEQKTIVE